MTHTEALDCPCGPVTMTALGGGHVQLHRDSPPAGERMPQMVTCSNCGTATPVVVPDPMCFECGTWHHRGLHEVGGISPPPVAGVAVTLRCPIPLDRVGDCDWTTTYMPRTFAQRAGRRPELLNAWDAFLAHVASHQPSDLAAVRPKVAA